MFDKNKWTKTDTEQYKKSIYVKNKGNNSIIRPSMPVHKSFEVTNSLLKDIPFVIKDNFAVPLEKTTSASKILNNFVPNYTSTVYRKLVEAGAFPIAKSNLDELAMGGTGLTSNFGPVVNPFDESRIAGGSSSGSNYLVANGSVPFAIGSDTGDSVRKPAAYTGIVGFKPTWGLVSRNGLFDFAPTWDTVAWFTNTVHQSAQIMDVLQGYDPDDASSMHPKQFDYKRDIRMLEEKMDVIIMKDIEKYILDKEVKDDYIKVLRLLRKDGHTLIEVEPDYKILGTILAVYRTISSVEAFSCNSNLTGFQFGNYFEQGLGYEEAIIKARTLGFDYEVKKRFLWAQEVRYSDEQEYIKATKLRTLINKELNRILEEGDVMVTPTTPDLAPKIDDLNEFDQKNVLNNLLTGFNSNGSPSISVPITRDGADSTSVTVSGLPFSDKQVLRMANRIEIINGKRDERMEALKEEEDE